MAAVTGLACAPTPPAPPDEDGTAAFVGSAVCMTCHSQIGALHALHGHSQALKPIRGQAPSYPAPEADGVPDPPVGFDWTDISYLIGGYLKAANFLDQDGFVLTDGSAGTPSQYVLTNGVAGLAAGFTTFEADRSTPLPYAFDCFRCHTTGPVEATADDGLHQENRPGILGTWAEAGVQCEACHGPGSLHIPDPPAGNIRITGSSELCAPCHGPEDITELRLAAANGFLLSNQQYQEVQASPHADFTCTTCHNPHASTRYDRTNGIRNTCRTCHTDQNMALHSGKVYVFGDYVEYLSCESCHMPPAARQASSAVIEGIGDIQGRAGDTRTHVMFIDTLERDFSQMLTPDGTQVRTDASGQAHITHHGQGSAFPLTLGGAASIAEDMHSKARDGSSQTSTE